jgi:hypothetical protein
MQTKMLVIVAGAALGLSASAFAQNANLDQSRAYNAELVADAGTRASLLAGGAAGNSTYAGTFGIGDSTGANRLNIGGTTWLRYNVSMRDDVSVGDVDDLTLGFNNPTNRIRFWGNVWDKNLTFKVQGNFGGEFSDSGIFGLEDAYGMYSWDSGFAIKWGQFRMPLMREFSVEDEFQLAADRSLVTRVFSPGYTQGVQFSWQSDDFRFVGGFTDGLNTGNTDFNSAAEADLALNARFDWKVMGGSWERFNDITSFRSATDNALLVGGGFEWQTSGETGGTGGSDVDSILYTIDASWEGPGYNVMAAGYGAHLDPAGGTDLDNFGGIVQGGIFVTEQIELFGRYSVISFDDDAGADPATLHFAEAGMNYYISKESHAAKFTVQAGYAFNDTTALFGTGGLLGGNTRNGFLGDSEDGEISIMAQMQLVW